MPSIVATTRSVNPGASGRRPIVRSACSRSGEVTLPPGVFAFWATIASRTAVTGRS